MSDILGNRPPHDYAAERGVGDAERLAEAGEIYRNASGGLAWEEAVRAVDTVAGLDGVRGFSLPKEVLQDLAARSGSTLSDQDAERLQQPPALVDYVTNGAELYALTGSLDVRLQYGSEAWRSRMLTYAAEFEQLITHYGGGQAVRMYAATFVEPGADFIAHLAERRFPDMDPADKQSLVASATSHVRNMTKAS